MKTVILVASNLDDVHPIKLRQNRIEFKLRMNDAQIAYNRMVLLDAQIKDREIPKIRAIK